MYYRKSSYISTRSLSFSSYVDQNVENLIINLRFSINLTDKKPLHLTLIPLVWTIMKSFITKLMTMRHISNQLLIVNRLKCRTESNSSNIAIWTNSLCRTKKINMKKHGEQRFDSKSTARDMLNYDDQENDCLSNDSKDKNKTNSKQSDNATME